MKKLVFSPKATSDIDRIYDYTEENGVTSKRRSMSSLCVIVVMLW